MSQISELNEQELSRETRPNLEAYAVELGLTDASTFQNKPAVLDAIKRVKGGEDAAVVNAELRVEPETPAPSTETTPAPVQTNDDAEDDTTPANDAENASEGAGSRNQGHPTAFTNTGAPKY